MAFRFVSGGRHSGLLRRFVSVVASLQASYGVVKHAAAMHVAVKGAAGAARAVARNAPALVAKPGSRTLDAGVVVAAPVVSVRPRQSGSAAGVRGVWGDDRTSAPRRLPWYYSAGGAAAW